MEFKLKLCFQNDLIRFIGDKLDKISKLILVCMKYFILIEISYLRWIFCMITKLYRNKLGIFLFSPPREIFPVIHVQFLHKRPFTDLWVY
jgi:hypothetical protein